MFKKGQLIYYRSKECIAIYDTEIDSSFLLGTKCYGIQVYQEKNNRFLPTFVQQFEIEEIPIIQIKALLTHKNQTLRKAAKDNLSGRDFVTINLPNEIDVAFVLKLFTKSYIQEAKRRKRQEEIKIKLADLFASVLQQDLRVVEILAGEEAFWGLRELAQDANPTGKNILRNSIWGVEFKFEKSLGPWEMEAKKEP